MKTYKNKPKFIILTLALIALIAAVGILAFQQMKPNALPLTPVSPLPSAEQTTKVAVQESKEGQPRIDIDKIGVTSSIITDVDATNTKTYNDALSKGVALMRGTASLDAAKGNSFIFGHSSRFPKTGTKYDTIFAKLPDLKEGDTFTITADNKKRTFKVTQTKVVSATDLSVLEDGDKHEITLMTCWPINTSLKRWIVKATEVAVQSI